MKALIISRYTNRAGVRHTLCQVNDASNTSPIFIAAGIFALTGLYFLASGIPIGALIVEILAVALICLGVYLRKRYRASR
jgi:hypothetical protein